MSIKKGKYNDWSELLIDLILGLLMLMTIGTALALLIF